MALERPQSAQVSSSMASLKRLWGYARDNHKRPQILLAIFYSVTNKILDIAPPLLIGMAVDVVTQKKAPYLGMFQDHSPMSLLYGVGVLTLIIWVLESLTEYAMNVQWKNLAQSIQHHLRLDTYQHIQKLDLSYFENQSTGQLISILNDDINQLERFLNVGANDLIQVGTTVVIIGGIFFWFSPLLTIISFLPIPLILWGSFYFQKKMHHRYSQVRDEAGLLRRHHDNNLTGIATIKTYSTEVHEVNRINSQSEKYRQANKFAIALSSSYSPLIRMCVLFGFLVTLIYGGQLTLNGTMYVGQYSVLVFLIQRLLWPLTRLGDTFDLFQRAQASTDRILGLLGLPFTIRGGSTQIPKNQLQGALSFESVSFHYPTTTRMVLKNLSFSISARETIGIVGATGVGKSTVIKLLLRLYDPQSGTIKLDGIPIQNLELSTLRSAFAYVGQEPFLFHGTVKENIQYGSFQASTTEIEKSAAAAEAHEFILGLPEGYNTIVGERGQKLSGGQKQRLSIARAILKDAPILLFDEATSAVDNETEAAIQRSLHRISQDRTVIMVAHRLSTLVNADRILVLENGEVSEMGNHRELIEKQGKYHQLWKVQTGSSVEGLRRP